MTDQSRIKNLFFTAVFLALISLPALLLAAGFKPILTLTENRTLASFPNLKLSDPRKAIAGFEKYFKDRFGFRPELIMFNRALRYLVLNTPGYNKVIFGRNDWLIFRLKPDLIETRNLRLFSAEELQAWGKALQARADYAEKVGAAYLVVIAPDSKTIFPEALPEWIPPPLAQSRMSQLYDYLAAHHPRVNFLDLRPVLKAHRDEPIYFHTDTHWTTLGAFYAYREIMHKLQELRPALAPAFKPMEIEEFDLVPKTNIGDMVLLLGLPTIIKEQSVALKPRRIWETDVRGRPIDDHNFITDNPHRPNAPRLVIFRDSFTWAMQAPLSEHFSFAHFRWVYGFERKLVKRDKPDVVLQMFVERELGAEKPRSFLPD